MRVPGRLVLHSRALLYAQVSGDPRRPGDVQGYEPPIPTEPTGDIMMLGGMVAALLGLVLKVRSSAAGQPPLGARLQRRARRVQLKVLGWLGLYAGLSSIANMRTGQLDIKALTTTLMCACVLAARLPLRVWLSCR